ncbi:MAG: hypothetical protein ABIO48_17285 [Pedococcus sp.]
MGRAEGGRDPGRWVLPLVLALAGGLWAAAAVERWWPACRPGERGSLACTLIQDHRFDYVAPSAPWVPVGSAAQYAGAGYLALAVAFAVMAAGRPRPVGLPLGSVLALVTAVVGMVTVASGVLERPVAPAIGVVAMAVWGLAGPLLILGLCALRVRPRRGPDPAWFTTAFLVLATPIPGFLFTPTFGHGSYDTASWDGMLGAIMLVLAGGAALASACLPDVRSPAGEGDGEDGVAGGGGELDVAAVRLGNRVDDRQAQPG